MQKRWKAYSVIALIVIGVESMAIWMGSDSWLNVIRLEGKQVWIFHEVTRIALWSITTLCEIFAIGRTYFWPSSNLRSYMLMLFTLYYGVDFLMPISLAMFPDLAFAPLVFGLLALIIIVLMSLSFFKDKFVSCLLIPSLAFMVFRCLFKMGVVL